MISGYFTHQASFARIDDLRRQAERRRLVALARGQRGHEREAIRRERALRLRTVVSLRARRPTAA